jgi:hypothetical protein
MLVYVWVEFFRTRSVVHLSSLPGDLCSFIYLAGCLISTTIWVRSQLGWHESHSWKEHEQSRNLSSPLELTTTLNFLSSSTIMYMPSLQILSPRMEYRDSCNRALLRFNPKWPISQTNGLLSCPQKPLPQIKQLILTTASPTCTLRSSVLLLCPSSVSLHFDRYVLLSLSQCQLWYNSGHASKWENA